MKPRYSLEEFNKAERHTKLPLECEYCGKIFYLEKRSLVAVYAGKKTQKTGKAKFCSIQCVGKSNRLWEEVSCDHCGKLFYKKPCEMRKTKHNFCTHSCAATYSNTHKTKGTRRSKLEVWLEENIKVLFPRAEIHYSRKDAVGSELDIYVPCLKLAFEVNGVFHYKPIFGQKKLLEIQANDLLKKKACKKEGIFLSIIDVSSMSYFSVKHAQPVLAKILDVIRDRVEDTLM